jgi:hypothetical protein
VRISPPVSSPVTGSAGRQPDIKAQLPFLTACEYGPIALGAAGVVIILFPIKSPYPVCYNNKSKVQYFCVYLYSIKKSESFQENKIIKIDRKMLFWS